MSRKKAGAPLGVVGLLAAAVAVAVLIAPGTLSYFVSSAQTPATTVSTGEAALSIAGSGGPSGTVYPGGPTQLLATRTITNTGDVALSLVSAFTATGALAPSLTITVSVQSGACAATPPATWPADSGRWQGTTAGLTTSVPTTIGIGATRRLCAWQRLGVNAPNGTQGQAAPVSITVTGTQVAP